MKRSYIFSGLAILALLTLLMVSALLWVPHWFLGNESFRQAMNRETSSALNIDGEWMPFRLNGWTLQSDGYEGMGIFNSYQVHIRAEQLSFKIKWRALLKRQWHIEPVEVQKLNIHITSLTESATTPTPAQPIAPPSFPKAATLFIPQAVDIKEIILSDVSIAWETSNGEKYLFSQIKTKSIADGLGAWNTAVTHGIFSPPQRHSWKLNSARLAGDLQSMNLHHSEWLGTNSGVIKISGPLTSNGKMDAELKLEGRGIPATSIVPMNWESYIEGNVDGDATARINRQGILLEGEATGKNIMLIGVPMLRSMQLATGIREWTELPLEKAWVQFKYTDNDLQISSSVFAAKDLTRLEGNLQIQNNQLSGTYQVGLSQRVVSRIPGASQTVFTLNQNGYYWAQPPMTLSGTIHAPQEDLSPRLKSAVFDAVEKKINEGVGKGLNILDSLFNRIQ